MRLKDAKILVTGGSRGLGLGTVEALVDAGARVTTIARNADDLRALAARLPIETVEGDIAEPGIAARLLGDIRPDALVLNAGGVPAMGPIDQISWDAFSEVWNSDVKAALQWVQAALNTPLATGSRVLLMSSGAAVQGSPMSGGYAGAKRMMWLMANYAEKRSRERALGIRFQTIVPRQMIADTGVGGSGAEAYSRKAGITPEAFLAGFGAPMPPRQVGDHVVTLLSEPAYAAPQAFGFKGDSGITILEEAAA